MFDSRPQMMRIIIMRFMFLRSKDTLRIFSRNAPAAAAAAAEAGLIIFIFHKGRQLRLFNTVIIIRSGK
jgi:hypothetical protein